MKIITTYLSCALLAVAVGSSVVGCKEKMKINNQNESGQIKSADSSALFNDAQSSNVLATVGKEKITQGQVDKEIAAMFEGQKGLSSIPSEKLVQFREKMTGRILESLVVRSLLTNAVSSGNIVVTDVDIDDGISKIKSALPQGMTIEDYLTQLNMTMGDFKKALVNDLKVAKLLKGRVDSIPQPTELEIDSFYQENESRFSLPEMVKASHILIKFDPSDTDAIKAEKKTKIDSIRSRLVAGEDFAAVASQTSDCPSKIRGGDLGSFGKGQMVPQFENAAFAQPTNTIGEVVETQYGYHIIKVSEHTLPHKQSLDEVKAQIEKIVLTQKKQNVIEAYIEELKSKNPVVYAPGYNPTNNVQQ